MSRTIARSNGRSRWEKEMTTMVERAESDRQPHSDRYRAAERHLWQRYGIETRERWVELAEPRAQLRIVEVGSGRPVLFVPGTGGTGPYWAPLVGKLPGIRCLLLDRPGWGLSSPVDWTKGEFATITNRVLTGVLDELGLEKVDLVGASIGNLWGLRLAERHSERVGRLVLLGGFPSAASPVPTFIKLLTSPIGALIVRIPQSLKMQRSQVAAQGHAGSLAAGRMDEFIDWRLAFVRETPSMRHERSMARAVVRGGAYRPGVTFDDASLSAIAQPVRMVFGSADPTGSVEIWKRFTDSLPRGELLTVDDAGHLAWWDDPGRVAEAIHPFLAS
jgi:pimeloyl-ACP methyl ester carboxylesterase